MGRLRQPHTHTHTHTHILSHTTIGLCCHSSSLWSGRWTVLWPKLFAFPLITWRDYRNKPNLCKLYETLCTICRIFDWQYIYMDRLQIRLVSGIKSPCSELRNISVNTDCRHSGLWGSGAWESSRSGKWESFESCLEVRRVGGVQLLIMIEESVQSSHLRWHSRNFTECTVSWEKCI